MFLHYFAECLIYSSAAIVINIAIQPVDVGVTNEGELVIHRSA